MSRARPKEAFGSSTGQLAARGGKGGRIHKKQSRNPELLTKVEEAIKEERRRATGEFDGLLGSFPEGTSVVLANVLSYLREYLFDYKRLSEGEVRRLLDELETPLHAKRKGFRSLREPLDEGVNVAVGILNSIRSTLRVKGNQVIPRRADGRPIYDREPTDQEAVTLLLSGLDGLRGARVRVGGGKRSTWGIEEAQDKEIWHHKLQKLIDEGAQRTPKSSYRKLAKDVAKTEGCNERTVRRHTKNPMAKRERETTT